MESQKPPNDRESVARGGNRSKRETGLQPLKEKNVRISPHRPDQFWGTGPSGHWKRSYWTWPASPIKVDPASN
ncbi:hypothetical protein TNCT_258501 [Trichonephila clavata]|uniref:Uncharacterized protein n=1 Tax=Trichonephila clavata TaxID=2740835 RepID=A0A8X6J0N6_TRICU|nr:hypothetical protein TNCT_258501 [Trichonephila clavata]